MLHFIVNPTASSGTGLKIWNRTEAVLKRENAVYQIHFLKAAGDAAKTAAMLEQSGEDLTAVIVGGDGSVNEFLMGLSDFEHITLACIPVGSGNDFARHFALPSDPEKAVSMLLNPQEIQVIDVGCTSDGEKKRSFAVSTGIGFDAAVCYESGQSSLKKTLNRLHLGKLIYLLNALKMLFTMKMQPARFRIDDDRRLEFDRVCFAAAMNTRYEGGGFLFAPDASASDGSLDLLIAEGMSKLKILLILPTAFWGKHTRFQGVHLIRCRKAEIHFTAPSCVHVDGEHFGFSKQVTFSLNDKKLPVITG